MGSCATSSVLTNQFIPWSTTNTESPLDSKLGVIFYKMYRNTNKRQLSLSFAWDSYKIRSIGAIKSYKDVSYFQTEQVGSWEDPDTGSDSECDDEEYEEVEDENFGFESDSEEEGMKASVATDVNITSGDNYEELIKKGSFFFLLLYLFWNHNMVLITRRVRSWTGQSDSVQASELDWPKTADLRLDWPMISLLEQAQSKI